MQACLRSHELPHFIFQKLWDSVVGNHNHSKLDISCFENSVDPDVNIDYIKGKTLYDKQ